MKRLLLAAMLMLPGLARAHEYSVRDAGEFQPLGQLVEFYDRFGWRAYEVDFEFDLEGGGLGKSSRLSVKIVKKDGSRWDYSCKASRTLSANVNTLFDGRVSVVAECRIDAKSFAEAVDLHPDDVGAPNLVFQAIVQGGQAAPGAQCGIVLPRAQQSAGTELSPYLAAGDDPGGLAVVFQRGSSLQ
ncbi:MAG: hypothetical protein NTY77_06700 [Elusimicrobia bacterium]|nr:hypothetical protein [Elusimicrobiota bacterium]